MHVSLAWIREILDSRRIYCVVHIPALPNLDLVFTEVTALLDNDV